MQQIWQKAVSTSSHIEFGHSYLHTFDGHHRASMTLILKFCFPSNSSLQLSEQLDDSIGQEHKVISCTMCYYVGYAMVFRWYQFTENKPFNIVNLMYPFFPDERTRSKTVATIFRSCAKVVRAAISIIPSESKRSTAAKGKEDEKNNFAIWCQCGRVLAYKCQCYFRIRCVGVIDEHFGDFFVFRGIKFDIFPLLVATPK